MTTIAANRDQSIRIEDMFKNSTSFNDEEFLRAFRMNREQARNLVLLLQETSHFKDIGTKERPLLFQLLVFLYRVGQKGKAGSDSKVNQFFKIGKGTVRRYVRNVMRSLLELKDHFLCWPEREERAEISSRILVAPQTKKVGFGARGHVQNIRSHRNEGFRVSHKQIENV